MARPLPRACCPLMRELRAGTYPNGTAPLEVAKYPCCVDEEDGLTYPGMHRLNASHHHEWLRAHHHHHNLTTAGEAPLAHWHGWYRRSQRRLVLILGDSLAFESFAALLCLIERHGGVRPRIVDTRLNDTYGRRWGAVWPTPYALAAYPNGLRVAITSLTDRDPALTAHRHAPTVAEIVGRVRGGVRSWAELARHPPREPLKPPPREPEWPQGRGAHAPHGRLQVVLVGGGSHNLGNHWSGGGGGGLTLATPHCYAHRSGFVAHNDNSSAAPACAAAYAGLASATLDHVLRGLGDALTNSTQHHAQHNHEHNSTVMTAVNSTDPSDAAAAEEAAAAAVTMVGLGPAHFPTWNGEYKSLPLQTAAAVDARRRQLCVEHDARRTGNWRDDVLRDTAASRGVRFVDADQMLRGRHDAHIERRHKGPLPNPAGPSLRLDCLHWCMHGALWDPLMEAAVAHVE